MREWKSVVYQEPTSPPSALFGHTLTYMADTKKLIVFGGQENSKYSKTLYTIEIAKLLEHRIIVKKASTKTAPSTPNTPRPDVSGKRKSVSAIGAKSVTKNGPGKVPRLLV